MKKILLIEDNKVIRENTAEILEMTNYHVLTAENGKTGMQVALSENPDLIICDIMMPVLDGYGVLHIVRKNPGTKNTPFIFLTAKTERDDFRKGMELGADDYITKPFSGTELLNAVEGRLKKVEVLKEEFSGLMGFQKLMTLHSGNDILKELSTDRNINRYKSKQTIFSEGNRPICLFYIQKGKVKTFKTNENGKELVMDLYNEGDFVGFISLLENVNYQETAVAMEESELAIIPREDFEELLNSNPEVTHKFIQLLAKNISEKKNQLLGIAYNSLRKKVAEALMMLHKKYNAGADQKFTINFTRENLATIAGTATESLIRTLGDFKDEKLIEIKDGMIIILSEEKLTNLIN